jgi:putative hemolysin
MATLLPALRVWRRPLVAGAAACLFLWHALILAVSAPVFAHHAGHGAAAVSGAFCAAAGGEGAPAHPVPSRHCAFCAIGARDMTPTLFAPVAIALLAFAPPPPAPAARICDAPPPQPSRRPLSAAPRAPPFVV